MPLPHSVWGRFCIFLNFLVQRKLDASAFTVILCNQPLKSEGDVFIWKTDLSKKSFGTLPPSKNEKFKISFFKKLKSAYTMIWHRLGVNWVWNTVLVKVTSQNTWKWNFSWSPLIAITVAAYKETISSYSSNF